MSNEQRIEMQQKLREIALFLEGMKLVKGNLLPLGTVHLDALWAAIQNLDAR